jgi:hypothetical protein
MQYLANPDYSPNLSTVAPLGLARKILTGRAWFMLAFLAGFSCVAQEGNPPCGAKAPAPAPAASQAAPAPQQSKRPASAAGDPKKQLSDQSAQLLAMAIALKSEVDKTSKDTLSVAVIRKADEIEKLARSVKEKMKTSVKN